MNLIQFFEGHNCPVIISDVNQDSFKQYVYLIPQGNTTVTKIKRLLPDIELFLGYKCYIDIEGHYIKLSHDLNNRPIKTFFECKGNIDKAIKNHKKIIPIMGGFLDNGNVLAFDLATMPHLLIGGSTGSGKSIYLHNIIASLMYNDNLRIVPIDVKRVEYGFYENYDTTRSHLYYGQVIKDAYKGIQALKDLCNTMDQRYKTLERANCRNIQEYINKGYKMEYIAIIIDELADLMLYDKKQVEYYIMRLTQLARACGIHLIVATQRPSTDVLTGVIKANIPCRIALRTANSYDSITILGCKGAEVLRGKGDMIVHTTEYNFNIRLQAPYIDQTIIEQLI